MQEIKEIIKELYEKSANLTPEQYEEVRTNSEKDLTPEMKNNPVVMKVFAGVLDEMKSRINRSGGGYSKWIIWKGA